MFKNKVSILWVTFFLKNLRVMFIKKFNSLCPPFKNKSKFFETSSILWVIFEKKGSILWVIFKKKSSIHCVIWKESISVSRIQKISSLLWVIFSKSLERKVSVLQKVHFFVAKIFKKVQVFESWKKNQQFFESCKKEGSFLWIKFWNQKKKFKSFTWYPRRVQFFQFFECVFWKKNNSLSHVEKKDSILWDIFKNKVNSLSHIPTKKVQLFDSFSKKKR